MCVCVCDLTALAVYLDLCVLVLAFCVHSTWHCALTVRLSSSDTNVTFDAFFVRFDVVVSLVFSSLLCVLSLLIVLYSVPCCCTRSSLLSCACTSILLFGLAYLYLAGVFVYIS